MRQIGVIAALAILVAGGCARAYPPPGGERDETPPRLIGTVPEALAVVPDWNEAVVFRFDERLSERNFSESLVVVSPRDGALRVQRGRSEVRVRIDGGWRPDRVYRVTLLPGVRDLFGNARVEPAEVVFSTGPSITETAVAGIVLDRISGRAAQNAVVVATRRPDSLTYTALADTAGFFALRHLPLGDYDLRAFSDQNRNRRRDGSEPVDSGRVVSLTAAADTQTVAFQVFAAATAPPRVTRAEPADSLHVRAAFDDYVDPDAPLDEVRAEILGEDSTRFATVAGVEHPAVWEERQRESAARAQDTTAARPAAPPVRPRGAAEPDRTRPVRELMVRLAAPLPPGAYLLRLENVLSLSGFTGGGTVRFEVRAPAERPPAARPDTTEARLRY